MTAKNSSDPDATDTSLTEQIGGVQGEKDMEAASAPKASPAAQDAPGSPPDDPAPDAAEIEWAGGLVKKPPRPAE